MIAWVKSWTIFDWLYLGIVAQAVVVEAAAVHRKASGDTISEAVRWLFGIGDDRNPAVWTARGLLIGFAVWFGGHLRYRRL